MVSSQSHCFVFYICGGLFSGGIPFHAKQLHKELPVTFEVDHIESEIQNLAIDARMRLLA